MYLAQKRGVQALLKSGGILVGAFALGFVVQTSFGVAEFLQASVTVQTPGSIQSILTSNVQCSNVAKSMCLLLVEVGNMPFHWIAQN